jgi:hypothetical protein
MPQEYLWNAEALKGIREKDLDKHFDKNKSRYQEFAKTFWKTMKLAANQSGQLQKADLYTVLHELIALDDKLTQALKAKGISDARRSRWISWFTWYIVEQSWALL